MLLWLINDNFFAHAQAHDGALRIISNKIGLILEVELPMVEGICMLISLKTGNRAKCKSLIKGKGPSGSRSDVRIRSNCERD